MRERNLSVDDDLSYLREFEHITLARVLIASFRRDRSDETIQKVLGFVERLLIAAEDAGRTTPAIEILVLQVLAHEAQGDIPSALVSLERALSLAEPEGYVRIFVDEGPVIQQMLTEAAKGGIYPDYASKLLAAFKSDRTGVGSQKPQNLVEPLSEREIEVLQLVALGLSNREIGDRLFLALDTIKGHNRNIYGKLGVKKRIKAVEKARELGLL